MYELIVIVGIVLIAIAIIGEFTGQFNIPQLSRRQRSALGIFGIIVLIIGVLPTIDFSMVDSLETMKLVMSSALVLSSMLLVILTFVVTAYINGKGEKKLDYLIYLRDLAYIAVSIFMLSFFSYLLSSLFVLNLQLTFRSSYIYSIILFLFTLSLIGLIVLVVKILSIVMK